MPTAIVLATSGKKSDIPMFLFTDKAVNKNFYSNSTLNPWSPYTGRLGVRLDMKKKVISSALVKSKVVKLCECSTCNSTIRINKFAASERSLQKHLFCPVCAADLHSQIPSGEDDMTMVPESEDDAVNGDEFPGIDENSEISELPDNDIRRASTMGEDDEESQGDMMDVAKRSAYLPMASNKKKLKNKAKKVKAKKHKDKKPRKDESEDNDPVREDVGTLKNKKPAVIDKPQDVTFQDVTGEPVSASVKKEHIVFNFNTINLAKARLTVVPVTTVKSYLFADEKPVMVLRANKASDEIKPLFGNPAKLLEALASTISAKSFDAKTFGAKAIRVKVSLPKTLAADQEKAKASAIAKYKSKIENLEGNYFDALCVAAVAVAKNTVEKNPNTLKKAIIRSMASNGVRNPEKIVDAAFASEGESLMRNIVAYARDYMGKSKTAQKEISKFVASASYNSTTNVADDVADQLGDDSMVAASVTMNNLNDDDEYSDNTVKPAKAATMPSGNDVDFFTRLIRNQA